MIFSCNITATITKDHSACVLENRPSLFVLQLHLLCVFGAGIAMSSWCWTSPSLRTWLRFIKK